MILADDAGGEWPMINHRPWNGCNLADFVMPFFLFIVGMANCTCSQGWFSLSCQTVDKLCIISCIIFLFHENRGFRSS